MRTVLEIKVDYDDLNYIVGSDMCHTENALRILANMLNAELEKIFPNYEINVILEPSIGTVGKYYLDGREIDSASNENKKIEEIFDVLLDKHKKVVKKIEENVTR